MTDLSNSRARELAEQAAGHVAALCAHGDRQPGTDRNRDAARYVIGALADAGATVESLPFEVPEWRAGEALLTLDGARVALHPGPYSPSVDATGPLVAVSTASELEALDPQTTEGAVLVLHGEIAAEQFTPRDYPWYSNPTHAAWLDRIELLAPAAVVAITDKNPAMTAALSPFPLIEDPGFTLPHAYCSPSEGAPLLDSVGEAATIAIDSSTRSSSGVQPVGRIKGGTSGTPASTDTDTDRRRVIVAAHFDSKWGTPGAIDNAAGVATLLLLARLLAEDPPDAAIELVPFNGEDHATSPGEVAYLDANLDGFDDVALMINVDGAGFLGSPAAVSLYNATDALRQATEIALAASARVETGPEWFASDHAIFAMKGAPCVAVTSRDFGELWESIAHTAADTPDNVDPALIAEVALTLERVVRLVLEV